MFNQIDTVSFVPLRPTADSEGIISRLEEDERNQLIKKCVQAAIVLGQGQTPIKKTELNKLVFPSSNFRLHNAILQSANYELNKVFGMRLFEMPDKARYLLVNSKFDFTAYQTFSQTEYGEFTVLLFVLLEIFASPDENLSEEDIRNSLSPMRLTNDELKVHLDSLTKQLYLTMTRISDIRHFAWGPRSIAEIDPDNFFHCFLEVVGNNTDKDWPEQKKKIDKLKHIENR